MSLLLLKRVSTKLKMGFCYLCCSNLDICFSFWKWPENWRMLSGKTGWKTGEDDQSDMASMQHAHPSFVEFCRLKQSL